MRKFAIVLTFVAAIACMVFTGPKIVHGEEVASGVAVPLSKDAVPVAGRPLTAVVVTQCNQLIVAYLTMPDGTLLRFDQTSGISADKLQQMAYTAPHSERVEAVCDEDTVPGVKGYESHGGPTT